MRYPEQPPEVMVVAGLIHGNRLGVPETLIYCHSCVNMARVKLGLPELPEPEPYVYKTWLAPARSAEERMADALERNGFLVDRENRTAAPIPCVVCGGRTPKMIYTRGQWFCEHDKPGARPRPSHFIVTK